jgi:signal transduction histidine kinase
MLRRKLLIVFGSLVVLLAAMAATAIWILQGALADLDRVNAQALAVADEVNRLNDGLTAVEVDLYQIQLGRQRHLDGLIDDVEAAHGLIASIGKHHVVHLPESEGPFQAVRELYPRFEQRVSSLATAQDENLSRKYTVAALADAMTLRQGVRKIDQNVREHARMEQEHLAGRFRWLVFGIAIGCLLVINISIIVLLRAAGMVLRPVDKLVEVSRQLTSEHLDKRAELQDADEFRELAEAYNRLAERIQSSERRRMEMLGQVSLTLNHELNNSIAIIELQLQLLGRQTDGGDRFETCLRNIKENLHRMAETVESLKHIRRIVLTDYISGVKMLDLQRSVQDESADEPSPPGGRVGDFGKAGEEAPTTEET